MKDILDEIKTIVHNQFATDTAEIIPCGNHELNRNLVYKITVNDLSYVIKFFYKTNKRIRELEAIPLFEDENPLKILASGQLDNGYEWLIYNYIEGWLLDHIIDDLDLDQLRQIFYQIGRKTAQFHSVKTFDYFGDWQKEKQSPLKDYKAFIIDDCERMIENISSQDIMHMGILKDAIEILRHEYKNVRDLEVGRLCHRDLDGRNILVRVCMTEGLKLEAFLDFEKCVVFNEYTDIIGFYRRYFLDEPKLIEPFFKGYEEILPIDASFNQELRFNLYRAGIDICSWSMQVSEDFYIDTIGYLKKLMHIDSEIETIYTKK